ncbi:hypothetical protein, partial [Paractinoplanes abujensis]|uniref:hypothetical protein n=1 Tax=Paractinoplanes abujensis TaxID=882441 RepID=UPI001EF3B771
MDDVAGRLTGAALVTAAVLLAAVPAPPWQVRAQPGAGDPCGGTWEWATGRLAGELGSAGPTRLGQPGPGSGVGEGRPAGGLYPDSGARNEPDGAE